MGEYGTRKARGSRQCPYSADCFECPEPDCKRKSTFCPYTNLLPYDVIRDYEESRSAPQNQTCGERLQADGINTRLKSKTPQRAKNNRYSKAANNLD